MEENNEPKVEEERKTVKIGLWTFTVLIVALITLAAAVFCGWLYVFGIKNTENTVNTTNQISNTVKETNNNSTNNEYTEENTSVDTTNYEYEEDWENYVYTDQDLVTVVKTKVTPEHSASTILKVLYENAYYIYNSQAGFEYKQGVIQNYDSVLNTHLNSKAKEQYLSWINQNNSVQMSEIINVKFKDIKVEDNKIEATVVGDLLLNEEVLKSGLESKFSIEYNGSNWVINEYAIPDTFIRDYVQYSEQYRITKLNEITDKFSVKDLLPDFLQTQDYQQDRYIKINNEINTYENNSIRVIDLYHKNNYNNLIEGDMKIKVSADKKSATFDNGNGQSMSIENINGTIKKIFIGIMHDIYTPVMLMENGTIKIVSYEYGKFYAKTLAGLEDIEDFRNVTISSFVKDSKGEYTTADPITAGTIFTCLIAIKADGTAYKITYY